jgi:hypothetical protein
MMPSRGLDQLLSNSALLLSCIRCTFTRSLHHL